jgi:hypothetical protein
LFEIQEFGTNLQHALDEVSSLQIFNKLLVKELEETTTKLGVMTGETVKLKSEESQNSWLSAGPKWHINAGREQRTKRYIHSTLPHRFKKQI